MAFIVTLISLVIERFFHWRHLRHWRWFIRYQQWLAARLSNQSSYLLLAAAILPPILLVGIINYFLSYWILAVIKLVFNVIILLYCFGPNNFWVEAYSCINELHKEDPRLAVEQTHMAFDIGHPEDAQSFHRAFTSAIFLAAYERVFGVVFWFVVLGPAGAVLYRSIGLCRKDALLGVKLLAVRIQQLLDWLPVRLFSFIFALGGHFNKVFHCWKDGVSKGLNSSYTLLTECGIAALDALDDGRIPEDGAAEKEALTLLDRVFVMFLVILAAGVLL